MASTAYSAATINIPPSPGYKVNTLFGWNATNNTTVPFTVVRALDTATRVNENGLIEVVPANVPRIDFAEGTGCGSLLVEPTRTNLITYSEQLDNAAWAKFNSSVTANAAVSPNGTTNADKLVENSATNEHFIRSSAISITSGNIYVMSLFAKAGERSIIRVGADDQGNLSGRAFFDLSNGTIGTITGGATAIIQPYVNGWYRCIVIATASGTVSGVNLEVNLATAGEVVIYLGNGTNGLFLYGGQLEQGSYPTSYIPTSGGTATRNQDVISLTGVPELIGQSEGSLMINLKSFSTDTYYISLSDTVNNRAFIKSDNFELFVAGVKQCDITQAVDFGVYSKTLISYAPADYKIAVDGNVNTTVGIDNQLTFPPNTLTTVSFNNLNISGGFPFYGRIKSLLIYKTALDSDLSEVLSGYATYNELAINKNYTVL